MNINGASYKFMYKYDDEPTFIFFPDNDIKISPSFVAKQGSGVAREIVKFTVTMPDGTQYIFGDGAYEKSAEIDLKFAQDEDVYPGESRFTHFWEAEAQTSVWYLKEIKSPYGQEIKFKYSLNRYSFFKLGESSAHGEVCPQPSEVEKTINKVYVDGASLRTITSTNKKIEFNNKHEICVSTPVGVRCHLASSAPARQDIDQWKETPQSNSSAKLLLEMMVMDNVASPTDTLFYNFDYGYFTDATDDLPSGYTIADVGNTHTKKLRLEKVSMPDNSHYRFRYKGDAPSYNGKSRLDMGIDHWGYSNGHTSNRVLTGLIPRDEDYPTCTPNTSDRETDAAFGFYGNLDSIIVSTGAEISLDYELHKAANYKDSTSFKPIGGSRIKEIHIKDAISNIETVKKYSYLTQDSLNSSGHLVLKPTYRYRRNTVNGSNSNIYSRLLSELGRPPVGYSRVTEKIEDSNGNSLGTTVTYFDQDTRIVTSRDTLYVNCSGTYPDPIVCDTLININPYRIAANGYGNPNSHQYTTGNVLRTETFNSEGDTLHVKNYEYTSTPIYVSLTKGAKVFKVNGQNLAYTFFSGDNIYYQYVNQYFYKYRLEKEEELVYSQDGQNPISSTTDYTYKDEMNAVYLDEYPGKHNAPVKVTSTDSRGHELESLTKYVAGFGKYGLDTTYAQYDCYDRYGERDVCDTTIYTIHVPYDSTEMRAIFEMQDKNMLYGIVESSSKDNDKLTSAGFNSYGKQIVNDATFDYYLKGNYAFEGLGVTDFNDVTYQRTNNDTLYKDTRFFPIAYLKDFNKYGIPTETKSFGGASSIVAFDTSATIPILSIFNSNGIIEDSIQNQYEQKIFGLSQKTGINGLQQKYIFYDQSDNYKTGQLKELRDKDNNVLAQYEYPFKGQSLEDSAGIFTTDISKNRLITRIPRKATSDAIQDYQNVNTSVAYSDGLGRGLQQVSYGLSPSGKDLLSGSPEYDNFGRPLKNYLPVPKPTLDGLYYSQFDSLATAFYQDTAAYSSIQLYEASPLSRVFKSIGAGAAFRPSKEEGQSFETGSFGLTRLLFTENGQFKIDTIINNQVYKQTQTDADGNLQISYKDKEGRLLESHVQFSGDGSQTAHFLKTAYVYDFLGRLVAVIPPLLYGEIPDNIYLEFSSFIDFIYFTKYDERGRVSKTHVPDAGWTYHCYNRLDQEVFRQNARQRNEHLWEWAKYDARGKNVLSGILYNDTLSLPYLQASFDKFLEEKQYEEASLLSGNMEGYTIRSFPAAIQNLIIPEDVMTVNYFDNYNWPNLDSTLAFKEFKTPKWTNSKGLLTGNKVRRLDTNEWLASAFYYDDKNRLIQSHSQNRFGTINQTDVVFDFIGQVLEERTIYRAKVGSLNMDDLIIGTKYTYDHAGRKLDAQHQINGTVETLASYEYDEIGRLISKNLNEARIDSIIQNDSLNTEIQDIAKQYILLKPGTIIDSSSVYLAQIASGLQKVNYNYDIRGNLHCINCDENGNLDSSKVFAMKLNYFQDDRYYNGLLSKQTWMADSLAKSYVYDYDKANRFKAADYQSDSLDNYDVNGILYDANGNIEALNRFGQTDTTTWGRIDSLVYTYSNLSNRLSAIDDYENDSLGFGNVAGTNEYSYYPDGSLKSDGNKGITDIVYNYMGLPDEILFGASQKIKNVYAADGQKLIQYLIDGSDTTKTEYIGDLIYVNNALTNIWHDEGRIHVAQDTLVRNWSDTLGNNFSDTSVVRAYTYQYFIEDHLGNNRVVFQKLNDSVFVAQRADYYPFGGLLGFDEKPFNYLFQGKESVPGWGYDFIARGYDPYSGRFSGVDPVNNYMVSGYAGMVNNPMSYIDPDGRNPIAIGFMIGLFSSQISNMISGKMPDNVWEYVKPGVAGAVGGAASYGIGALFGPVSGGGQSFNLGKEFARAGAHGLSNGSISAAFGGDFKQSFASGAFGSFTGSLTGEINNPFLQIGASGLAGGVGSELAGGTFLGGFATGAIVAGANHLLHPPEYEYKGKVYHSKEELYTAILKEQAMEQFGITDILALGAGLDNAFPSINKRFTTPGASSKTSYASKYGSKLLPQKLPVRIPTHLNKAGKKVYTRVLGRVLGRFAGPIGWGILAYDVGKTLYNTQNIYNSIIRR